MAVPLVSRGDFLRLDRHALAPLREGTPHDLILVTLSVDAEMMLHGYRVGIFAMPIPGNDTRPEVYAWYLPAIRAVIPLPPPPGTWLARPPKSLRKSMRGFSISVNRDFLSVLRSCADVPREGGWISPALEHAYLTLHAKGLALSVETWATDGELAGGLFAVHVGDFISGESMFHLRPDASKVALVALADIAMGQEVRFIDAQWPTDHLKRMGAIEVPWQRYLDALEGKPLGG